VIVVKSICGPVGAGRAGGVVVVVVAAACVGVALWRPRCIGLLFGILSRGAIVHGVSERRLRLASYFLWIPVLACPLEPGAPFRVHLMNAGSAKTRRNNTIGNENH
jgi:hypothetical protein